MQPGATILGRKIRVGIVRTQTVWTPDMESQLRTLWADGVTCSSIARKIGGITKNAVIGKAARLQLSRREPGNPLQNKINRKQFTRKRTSQHRREQNRLYQARYIARLKSEGKAIPKTKSGSKPFPFTPMVPVNLDSPPLDIPLMETKASQCRFIHGGKDLCCGHETLPGRPWCSYHFDAVFRHG